jgi:enoyl-CoA hydratase/carnithine racemase
VALGDAARADDADVHGVFLGAAALEVAKRIASKAPVAITATKQMISYTRDHSVAESFEYLNALQPAIFDIEEIKRSLKGSKRG